MPLKIQREYLNPPERFEPVTFGFVAQGERGQGDDDCRLI